MGLRGEASIVGLEMDTGVIRAVELKGRDGRAKVVAAGREELPEGAVVQGLVEDVDAVGSALERLWRKARFNSRDVVLGSFNQGVLMRLINFPKVPEDKLAQALRLQAGDYFPIPLSQMVLDFAVVGEVENNEMESSYEVLLVAAKKAQLDKCLTALRYSRLRAKVIDASPLALMRTLPQEKIADTVILVDICNGQSSLLMVSKGVPRFARFVPVSLQQYLDGLGLSLFEAEAGVQDRDFVAVGKENSDSSLLKKWVMDLAGEIRSSVGYVSKQENWDEVKMLMLSGRGARVEGLAGMLEDELAVPVEIVDPLKNVTLAGSRGVDWELDGTDFAVSIGLALRGLEV